MPRTKEVFKPEELCHVFVHKLQQRGRTAGTGNMSFEGDTFFSYRWYALAKHLNKKINGKPVILRTRDSYSSSTAKHLACLHRAISSNDFHVVWIERAGDISYSIRHVLGQIAEIKRKQARLKTGLKRFDYEGQVRSLVAHLDELKKLFPNKFELEQKKELAKIRRSFMPELEFVNGSLEYERHVAIRREAEETAFKEWLNGERSECPWSYKTDDGFNRVVIAKGEFRTSLGITIPVPVFSRLWKSFEQGQITVGSKILDFPVSEITSEAIRIGCHTLRIADLKQLAMQVQ